MLALNVLFNKSICILSCLEASPETFYRTGAAVKKKISYRTLLKHLTVLKFSLKKPFKAIGKEYDVI